jgi:hypothetical protein
MSSIAQTTLRSGLLAALAAAALFATLLAGVGTEPAAASHLKQKCFPSGSKTVYRTSEGRFYTRTVKPYFGGTKALFACSYRYGRSYRLWEGDFTEPDSYTRFRISGHFAGYVVDPGCANDPDCGVRPRVTSLNLRTGVVRAYYSATVDYGLEKVHDLVLRRNGSITSIATGTEFNDETPPSAIQVRALDAAGLRILDEGPGISLRSLELVSTTVSWVKDGVRKSATLR